MTKFVKTQFLLLAIGVSIISLNAQENTNQSKFKQLGQELPTPNVYRNAAGAPSQQYWQQRADYKMQIRLDDENQRIYGEETITYYNNSPDPLAYLWLQLDQNRREPEADFYVTQSTSVDNSLSLAQIKDLNPSFDGGFKIEYVKDEKGQTLPFTIVKTMMRVDLPQALPANGQYTFQIKWWYNINNRFAFGTRASDGLRSGYEYFAEDGNYLYTIAQFFPRMCVYDDVEGWQNKQFLGRGEFALTFGNYDVAITVPSDHKVAASGVLQNEAEVLSKEEQNRLQKARSSFENPQLVVTANEALANEKTKATDTKTWKFSAENVRDFAFASSRKFIWDAMGVKRKDGSVILAMSMYPKEGNPLWEKYSTKAVAHTLKWYSHYTFEYPYPVAWSIHTDRIGMEYPMICFNGGRPESDGTYTSRTKYGLISVIIHEVGHNYFPMIVNSDERQWTWMDEGLNSFLQYLSEQQWERDYPSRRGPAHKIVDYMKGDKNGIIPIMTNSESIYQFGNNAYGKPATALNILRESVLGRELFDFAFKTYANRWMFKHPAPADFFRTMEDASGIDLDWFWRGWFYTTDHVDIAIESVNWYRLNSKNPESENPISRNLEQNAPRHIGSIRNEKAIQQTQDEIDPSLKDFYTTYDPLNISTLDKEEYQDYLSTLSAEEKAILQSDVNYYEISFNNIGGLVMPLILQFEFTDGSLVQKTIPAEIWRYNSDKVSKVFVFEKELRAVQLDPFLEIADTDRSNNYYPPQSTLNRFELFKEKAEGENPMQRAMRAKSKRN